MLYKQCRKLVGDRGANSTLNLIRVTETQFADDTALYATFTELHLSQWQLHGSEKVYGYRE